MDSKVRWFRTEIPNMLDDADLSPHAYRLYGHIKRVAGDNGECNENTRHLGVKCQMSIGQVSKAKKELFERGFIHLGRGEFGRDVMKPTNLWQQNYEKYASSPNEQECSQYEQEFEARSDSEQDAKTCSPNEQEPETCSQYEHIENITTPTATQLVPAEPPKPVAEKIEAILKRLEKAKGNERSPILVEAYKVCFGENGDTPDYGRIGKAAKDVGGAGHLVELMCEVLARPPTGDKLAYLVKTHKRRTQAKTYTNGTQSNVDWQKAFDNQDVPEYIRDMQTGGK